MPSPLFVGIDVGSEANSVCCLTRDDEKRPVSRFTVTNNRPGILEFQDRITKLVQKHHAQEVLFGLEHTGGFSTHAAMYIQRHFDFGVRRKNVYLFNPSLIVDFLVKHGKNRFDDPEAVARTLQKAARSSYRLAQAMADSVNLAMASSIRVIRTVQEQLKALRKGIEDYLATIPQTLDSISGIGPICASGIVAELDVRSTLRARGRDPTTRVDIPKICKAPVL
ncbi:hypothetical protein [Effusibacillus dendaii]|uniref:Transposase n=1 Tax=Effusibacillus dendaii TaxID=2743772 RepID=A0A7I8D9B7_9BACL|nr:hypothetical protein [Effusibacillus dendaii]BCJ86597.1 hypothetical protein skT53_15820 [Effusibacillus dendaii]